MGSPRGYAPHLDDPDPPQELRTPEEHRVFAQRVRAMMLAKGQLKT
jgi:hypothetical protein